MTSKMSLCVDHIRGEDNVIADALSRALFDVTSTNFPGLIIAKFTPPSLPV